MPGPGDDRPTQGGVGVGSQPGQSVGTVVLLVRRGRVPKAGRAGTCSDQSRAAIMSHIENRPPWIDRFTRLINRSWASHGPCGGCHVSAVFNTDNSEWVIVAAP